MIRRIVRRYRDWELAKAERHKVLKQGTLLNAFYRSRTIFIHIPKTAGVSLVKAIYGDVTLSGHRSVYFHSIVLKPDKTKYFSFSFVRNPYDRLYSAYVFLSEGGINSHDKLAFATYLSRFKDFEDFVLNGLDKEMIFKITHFIPQYEYLCDKNGNVLVDFLGRFESLYDDVNHLSIKLGKNIKLCHYNRTEKRKYTNSYTQEMIDKVHRIYEKDIAIFEYSFK